MIFKNFTIKSIILFAILILCNINWTGLKSQVTIGSTALPNTGALLDLKEKDNLGANASKGLLLPRMELRSTSSMYPIFEDAMLTDDIKESHVGLTIFNLKEDYPNDLCRGIFVWTEGYLWERLPDPCCLPLTDIEIANSVFHFIEGDTPTFLAEITPFEASNPITYEWFIDNIAMPSSNNNIFSIPMDISLDGKGIKVKAYNNCSKTTLTSPEKILSIDALCKSVASVSISNTNLKFTEGELVEFITDISPSDVTSPVIFDWFIDGRLVKSVTDDNTVSLSMLLSYDNKEIKVKVSNCSNTVIESATKTLSVCKPIESIEIENSLRNKKFEFAVDKNIEFTSIIVPDDASGPFTYKWEFNETLVGSDPNYTRIIQKEDNGKKLKLTVSDGCSNTTQSTEVILSVIDCPKTDNIRIIYKGEGGSTVSKDSWDFTITEFENYTGEQLAELGITIKWYITDVYYAKPPKLKEVTTTNNEPHFIFRPTDFGYGGQTICLIAFSIEGAVDMMNCPMSSIKSDGLYRIKMQGTGATEPQYEQGNWEIEY